jgi:hypothetical protein
VGGGASEKSKWALGRVVSEVSKPKKDGVVSIIKGALVVIKGLIDGKGNKGQGLQGHDEVVKVVKMGNVRGGLADRRQEEQKAVCAG